MALDTLANVKTRLGISGSADDSLLNLLIDSAEDWIANRCGRDFAGGSFTEYFPGNVEFLLLANFPVTAVATVKVDPAGVFGADTVIASSSYVVHTERGVIQSKVGPFVAVAERAGLVNADRDTWTRSPRAVQVVYSTGTTVPDDVKEAHAQLIGHWYRQVKTQVASSFQNVDEQKFGDVTIRYRLDLLSTLPLPADVERLLMPYRTPAL